MCKRLAFIFLALFLSVCSCAQDEAASERWTDKNNTEQYAAYMLRTAYNEQGYWGATVEIKQAGTKRVFAVEPGQVYHIKQLDASGLSDLAGDLTLGAPRDGDVYSPVRLNEWIAAVETKYARRGKYEVHFDHAHAQVAIRAIFEARSPKAEPKR